MVNLDKKVLRKSMISKRKELSIEDKQKKSREIQLKLFNLDIYKDSNFIFTFISTEEEVDTHNIIKDSLKNGKRIGVPVTFPKERKMIVSEIKDFDNELELGFYNILTPKKEFIREVDPSILDLVLVPGLIFSKNGYRVGYGGGYYDRFLEQTEDVIKVGICFDMQIADEVPIGKYDIPVDYIITEKRIIDCKEHRF